MMSSDMDILLVKLDLPNQSVVKIDVKRTRPEIEDKFAFKSYLELALTYYCKYTKISYKQGLNELFAPFLCLRKYSPASSLHEILKVFLIFTEVFSPTFYIDEDFLSLEHSFLFLQLLLQYHDPQLSLHLRKRCITPELYSTPWLLTLFAAYLFLSNRSKHELEVVYQLWDFLIMSGIKDFAFYVAIALLINSREKVFAEAAVELPQVISSVCIQPEKVFETLEL
eukprot:TRINITY_DN22428_c0_g1_i3.p1 TRINITY_DN22428_c0_g1~~TRINITY_DN22428_c0_g1_i3.p1  ORF type:complete len:225 (+),score=43.85 TRINITY_DN22428_c0_g1_i3:281-955(+)